MDWFLENLDKLPSLIGYASVLTFALPTQTKTKVGAFLRVLSVVVNAVALDFKAAKAAVENKNVTITSKPRSELND